jgi:hypothetical protein
VGSCALLFDALRGSSCAGAIQRPRQTLVRIHTWQQSAELTEGDLAIALSLSNICLWETLVRPIIMTLQDAKSIAAGGGEVQPQGLVSLGTGLFVN